jgi:tetratricopeptide (TPR) repeat protein
MSLVPPLRAERLTPLLSNYFSKRFALPFQEESIPFTEATEDLLVKGEEALSTLCIERILLENYRDNLYSEGLLKRLLSVAALPGYVFYFKKGIPKDYPFFSLSKGLYFYPLLFGNIKELFIKLWRKKRTFRSLYVELTEDYSMTGLLSRVKFVSSLAFTRFNRKAKEALKELWELWEEGRAKTWMTLFKKPSSLLLVCDKPLSEEFLASLGHVNFKGGSLNYYLFERAKPAEVISQIKGLPGTFGVVPSKKWREEPFRRFNPLLIGFSAYEHAKRAGLKAHLLDGFTLHVLADLYYEWEDLGCALEVYELAKPFTLQPIELALSEASIYYALSELEGAEKILRGKLCGCLKEDPRIHYNLGIIYREKGNPDKAEYHLYKAYLLDEENPLFRRDLLRFLWDEGRTQEMEEILAKVKDLTKDDRVFLGKLAFLRRDYPKALSYLREVLDSPERDGEALYFLAWLYLYYKKDPSASEILLKEAKDKLPPGSYEKLREEFGLPK